MKIQSAAERDRLVKENDKLRKRILEQSTDDKLGRMSEFENAEKFFKPLTKEFEKLSTTSNALVPANPQTTVKHELIINAKDKDGVYGIKEMAGGIKKLGDKEIIFVDGKIIIDDNEYKSTKGLINLLYHRNPVDYSDEDVVNYSKMIFEDTNAGLNKNGGVKDNKSEKSELIKELYEKRKFMNVTKKRGSIHREPITSGTGLKHTGSPKTIHLPCDKNELLKMLDKYLASHKAGNTGVYNEIVVVCDELKRLGYITPVECNQIQNLITPNINEHYLRFKSKSTNR